MGWIARKRKRSQRFYAIPDRDEGVSFSEKVAMGIMVFVAFGAVVALYVGKVPLGVLLLLMVVLSGLSLPLAYNVGAYFCRSAMMIVGSNSGSSSAPWEFICTA